MYDVATQTVNKLSGELSSAFVEAAEANSNDGDVVSSSSEIVENSIPFPKTEIDRIDSNNFKYDVSKIFLTIMILVSSFSSFFKR